MSVYNVYAYIYIYIYILYIYAHNGAHASIPLSNCFVIIVYSISTDPKHKTNRSSMCL